MDEAAHALARLASIGSNQLSKRYTAVSPAGCENSGFVIGLFMAWSPARRSNVGGFEVDHPGDYATLNSNQLTDGTEEFASERSSSEHETWPGWSVGGAKVMQAAVESSASR
jgi:hypothetical protein